MAGEEGVGEGDSESVCDVDEEIPTSLSRPCVERMTARSGLRYSYLISNIASFLAQAFYDSL